MIRSISIVLVIWGLIVQPLMAAMPAPMADDSPHSYITSDSSAVAHAKGHHGDENVEEPSKAPCHENATDVASSEPCDNCEMDCTNGICASSCVVSGAAALPNSSVNLDFLSSSSVAAISRARTYRLPSRIFHPPKHA